MKSSPSFGNRTSLLAVFAAVLVLLGGAGDALAQGSACGPMDVVFVVDTTGSMGGALSNVKEDLAVLINLISNVSGGDFRVGLLEFHDDVIVLNDLGGDVQGVADNILGLFASGGANEPEASDEALNTVITRKKESDRAEGQQVGDFTSSFREDAAKLIILVTDARPAGFDDSYTVGVDDVAAHQLALTANALDIRISAVQVPTPFSLSTGAADIVEQIMRDYATSTGGKYTRTNEDGTGTADAIAEIIRSCGGATFFLTVDPISLFISSEEEGDFTVTTAKVGRFSSELTLGVENLPPGATVEFDPPVIPAPGNGTSAMRFTPGLSTLPGVYYVNVVATAADGSLTRSSRVKIILDCRPPFIFGLPANQPQSVTIAPGQRATLTVVPNGSGPFAYQWYRGPSGSIHFPISEATSATLTTDTLTATTDFWVRVINPCGSYDSMTATVTVSGPPPASNRTRGASRVSP